MLYCIDFYGYCCFFDASAAELITNTAENINSSYQFDFRKKFALLSCQQFYKPANVSAYNKNWCAFRAPNQIADLRSDDTITPGSAG